MPLYNPDLGLISAIQKYSTKDGPGIRSTVFMKGCPLGCLWCSNPELIRPRPDLMYARDKCAQCGTCIQVCPRNALSFGADGFIIIDRVACDGCGDCVPACPHAALELIGSLMGVDQVVDELLKDRVFYQTSGGGVTFSGGEPLLQSGFVAHCAARLKEEGVHVALDTAGNVGWCRFEEVLDSIDLVLFDLKFSYPGQHRLYTGRDNELILANLRLLAERAVPLFVRLVMVPGINDSEQEIRARMDLVAGMPNVQQVDILAYHRYGVGKYARLGLDYPLSDLPEYSPQRLVEIESLVASFGLPVTLGG